MSVNHANISVPANTVTFVAANPGQLTVTNTSSTATVYFGDPYVTASSYGVALYPLSSVHIGTLDNNIYAFSTSAATISILYVA